MPDNPIVATGGQALQDIKADVSALQQAYKNLADTVGHLSNKIDSLISHMGESARTQWGVLGTWVGVAVVIGTLAFGPVISKLSDHDDRMDWLRDNQVELRIQHAAEVAQLTTQVAYIEKEIDWRRQPTLEATKTTAELSAKVELIRHELNELQKELLSK